RLCILRITRWKFVKKFWMPLVNHSQTFYPFLPSFQWFVFFISDVAIQHFMSLLNLCLPSYTALQLHFPHKNKTGDFYLIFAEMANVTYRQISFPAKAFFDRPWLTRRLLNRQPVGACNLFVQQK